MNRIIITTAIVLVSSLQVAFSQTTSDNDLEQKIVKSQTLVWSDIRDLVVLLDSSENRVLTANAIVSQSLQPGGLAPAQKIDGLMIAGSALFVERIYEDSLFAYQSVIDLDIDSEAMITAYAAVGECYKLGEQDYLKAYDNYRQSVDLYFDLYPEGNSARIGMVMLHLLDMGDRVQKYSEVLSYAELAIQKFANADGKLPYDGYFLHVAGQTSEKLGDNTNAIIYYDRLLAEYPEYMNHEPLMGSIPAIKIKRTLLAGSIWEMPDEALVNMALSIIDDVQYRKMPIRINTAEKLAQVLVKQNQYQTANNLRVAVIDDVGEVIDELGSDSHDGILAKVLSRQRTISIWMASLSYYDIGDTTNALAMLDMIVQEERYPIDQFIEYATGMIAKIEAEINTP